MDIENNDTNIEPVPQQSIEETGHKKTLLIGGVVLVLAVLGGFVVHVYLQNRGLTFAPNAGSIQSTTNQVD